MRRLLASCAVVVTCGAFTSLGQSPPPLLVDVSASSQVRLSWADTPGNIVIEETETFSVWRPVPQIPSLLNGQFSVLVDITGGTRFFRLHRSQTGGLPPDPASVAPPVPQGVATLLAEATTFLYTGPNPIQTGVASGTIEARRVAVLRGKVAARDGSPLPAVTISVLGHPEFGQTLTRTDGAFDLAVNGGGQLTLRYEKNGFLAAQRAIVAPWRDYAWLPDLVMIPFDPAVTAIDLGAANMQVARGSAVSDADGGRRATILFPPGTSATMVLPDGSTQSLTTLNVRATEYTIGDSGPKAMPAPLPPSSGYTYAAELSVDEAIAAGATEVRFSQALPMYVENFVGFPVGTAVPTGYYDRQKGQWIASANGRVIKVLGIAGGLADLDTDGDAAADDATRLATLGVTSEERARLAQLYTVGQTLWRVPITHFTPWDCNWPYGPPSNAIPPPGQGPDDPPLDDTSEECGSIIGIENQSLGESVPVSGTPWRLHYKSDRTPGHKDASTLDIPVSGAAAIPASLRAIRVEVTIAGRLYQQAFAPAPNLTSTVTWDGLDGYGRRLQGAQIAVVQVHYDYVPQYYGVNSSFQASFAQSAAAGAAVTASRAAGTITLSKEWTEKVGPMDARAFGLGGWSLSVQHAYDSVSRRLLLGDGRQRSAEALSPVITAVAGNGVPFGFSGDGGPATAAQISQPFGVAVGPDGSLYIAATGNRRILRVGPDGIITTVAGNGQGGFFTGDGGPATASELYDPFGVAVGPDGSLYIADTRNYRIRRVGPDGIITTVAGNGVPGFSGDGGPATAGQIGEPFGVAVGPDGSLYIADHNNQVIRRVGTDGIITTVAGNVGVTDFSGDGGPATAAGLCHPYGVAVGPDGSLYIAALGNNTRIRRVGPDGIITTVAGNDVPGFSGDGGPATAAQIGQPFGVAVGPDGSLYIADQSNHRIRRVGPDGIITTVAGNGTPGFSRDGGPATAAAIKNPSGVAVGPDGSLYIADTNNHVIRRVGPSLPDFSSTEVLLPSEDGREIYVFNSSGRHLKTRDALTAALRYQFGYDSSGYLTSVTDDSGNVTTIERTGATPTAIVAPGGQRTALIVGADGWLLGATNPAGEAHAISHSADGLMQTFTDPRGKIHRFTYDALGRLIKDEDPVGGSITLNRTEQSNGYTVTTTSALGRTRAYQVEQLATGAIRRTANGACCGAKTGTVIGTDGSEQITNDDGSVITIQYGPDPRWGMLAPVATRVILKTPGGRTRTVTTTRTATLSDPNNLFSLTRLTDTVTDNGVVSTRVYDGASRVFTGTTAAGRSGTLTLDAQGRVTQERMAELAPVSYAYDARGLFTNITEGSGATLRTTTLTHNAARDLSAVRDAGGRTLNFTYNPAGQVVAQTLPDSRIIEFFYDAAGNATGIAPPGRPRHDFAYTPINLLSFYMPPTIGAGSTATEYIADADRALTRIIRPDGQVVDFTYDAAGRLSTLGFARGRLSYTYSPTTAQLTGLNAPGGIVLGYSYDGALLTGVTWTGPVTGAVTHAYNDDFRVTTENVNGTSSVSFAYDIDGFLTTAGPLNLTRKTENGLITGTTLGGVTHAAGYNHLAELTNYSAAYAGNEIYRVQHAQDAIGLITQQIETIGGLTATNEYTYDTAGRLTGVTRNGTPVTTYTYDSNGNRTRSTGPSGTVSAAYDNQDRLLTYGSASYNYNAHGELQSKTAGGSTTTYQYDALGNLTAATLPGGNVIDYLIDGRNRRIGKKVNGTLVQGFLYQGPLRPITELDGSNAVVSRFVYASRSSIPDFMIKAGVTYRIISDHLSSPRLVIDVATGTVAQRMNYDEFGNVTLDSNPGFQPFGFAGGVYDMDTKLVRYGARDYDAETGRWTARDPIRFAGGQTNLYAYVNHDPVNSTDRSGLGGEETGYSHILGWSQGGIAEGKIGGLTWDAKGFVTKDPNGQGLFNVKASLEGPLGRGNLLVELQGEGAFCPSRPVGSVWGKANYNVPLGYGFSVDANASFESGLNGKGTWNAEAVGKGYGFQLGVEASGDFSGNAQSGLVLIFPFQ